MWNLPELWKGEKNDSFRAVSQMQKQMDRLFEQFFNEPGLPTLSRGTIPKFAPTCDISETETKYLMTFDLPGMSKEDVRIEVTDNVLHVFGERKEEHEEKKKNLFRSERFFGAFERYFTLPTQVTADQIEAAYEKGVLSISIPKAEASKTKKVKVVEKKSAQLEKLTAKSEAGH
ncbi:MAG: Hsp20/alpha crystallin family protein [Bdellovibrionota bacterium]